MITRDYYTIIGDDTDYSLDIGTKTVNPASPDKIITN